MRGTEINITPLSQESYIETQKAFGLPPHILEDRADAVFTSELGYYFGKETSAEQLKVREAPGKVQ